MPYLVSNKKVFKNGEVLAYLLKFDGRDDLEYPIDLQINIMVSPAGRVLFLGQAMTRIPLEIDVLNPSQVHHFHGRQFWMEHETFALTCEGVETPYLIFVVEEVNNDSVTLYFPAYLPPGSGGDGVIVYDERQNLESTRA